MTAAPARRCACGRPLRDPTSVARGLGPVCFRRLHNPAASGSTGQPAAIPGQLAFDDPGPPPPRRRGQGWGLEAHQLTWEQLRRIVDVPTRGLL
jgi:hypothetical protein